MTLGHRPRCLSSFERITDSVTGGQITSMRPIPEDLRLQYKEAFTRRQPRSLTPVYLSYAPEDRMWADWIEAVLTRADFRVIPRSTVPAVAASGDIRSIAAEHELQGAPRAIAVLSSAYMHSPKPGPSGKRCRQRTQPGRTGSSCRSGSATSGSPNHLPTTRSWTSPAWTQTRQPRSCCGRWTGPPSPPAAGRPGRGCRGSPARSRRSGTCPPGTPTSPGAAQRWRRCVTSWRAAESPWWSPRLCTAWAAWARPSSPWSTRTGSWPTTTWSGGCRRSGPRRSASPSPSWPGSWVCRSATTWPRRPRQRWRNCAATPRRTGC